MLNKEILYRIQSGSDTEVYTTATNAALYMATGGFLEEANQLLSELWKHKLPHDRNTWMADRAFTVLWNAAGRQPNFIPFLPEDIDFIEKELRAYIAVDRWAYPMPGKPWTELTGQDLLRKAFIKAGIINQDGSRPLSLDMVIDPPTTGSGSFQDEYINKVEHYLESLSAQASGRFPSSNDELEALAMLEKLAAESTFYFEGFVLAAELAARNGKMATAIQMAKLCAKGYHENHLGSLFPLLPCSRHIAPLLLQRIVADELHLSESVVQDFVSQATPVLDRRLQQGRSLAYGDLSWEDLLSKISHACTDLEDGNNDEAIMASGWVGWEGAAVNEIALAEKRLGITLPEDYKQFLLVSNGVRAFSLCKPSLLPVNEIDFISNVLDADDYSTLLNWPGDNEGTETFRDCMEKGIMISRYPDEQMVWLIPLTTGSGTTWQTWFFAYWLPGDSRYPGFRYYMEQELRDLEAS